MGARNGGAIMRVMDDGSRTHVVGLTSLLYGWGTRLCVEMHCSCGTLLRSTA